MFNVNKVIEKIYRRLNKLCFAKLCVVFQREKDVFTFTSTIKYLVVLNVRKHLKT